MSAAEKIPWTELAMSADECAQLWGISADRFLRTYASGSPGSAGRLNCHRRSATALTMASTSIPSTVFSSPVTGWM